MNRYVIWPSEVEGTRYAPTGLVDNLGREIWKATPPDPPPPPFGFQWD